MVASPRTLLLVLVALCTGLVTLAAPADGSPLDPFEIDTGYASAGIATPGTGAVGTSSNVMVRQPDGGLVLLASNGLRTMLTRLSPDGQVDRAFGTNGQVALSVAGADAFLLGLTLDGEGNIIVCGEALTMGPRPFVARLLPSGAYDTRFGNGGVITATGAWFEHVAVDSVGRIVVAGDSVSRFDPSGAPDTAFGSAGRTTLDFGPLGADSGRPLVSALRLPGDGRIVLAGTVGNRSDPTSDAFVARLRPDGTPDPAFGIGGAAVGGFPHRVPTADRVYAATVTPDGGVIVAGTTGPVPLATPDDSGTFVARFDAAGRPDPSVGLGAGVILPRSTNLETVASDGLLADRDGWLLIGRAGSSRSVLSMERVGGDGRPDTSFGYRGLQELDLDTGWVQNPLSVLLGPDGCLYAAVHGTGYAARPSPGLVVARLQPTPHRAGYWMLGAGGAVYSFGAARFSGTAAPEFPWVDIEPTPTGKGYWALEAGGGLNAFGDARLYGGPAYGALDRDHATSLSATPSGRGYWIFTAAGRVLPYGDAQFFGDTTTVRLNAPMLGSVATPTGLGYYMVAADGGIFTFGDARFFGSMGNWRLNAPVRGLVPDPDGSGYWLIAADGGIFSFDARFHGSLGGTKLNQPIIGAVRFGDGYLMVAADGGIFNFSDKPFSGSLGDRPPVRPVVSVAAFDV